MTAFLAYTVVGLVAGCVYALSATGLVVTYTTSGVFNFANGAVGMLGAFGFWQLESDGVPALPALLLVVLVFAPALGWVIHATLMRRVHGRDVDATLTITVGLLLLLLAVGTIAWNPSVPRHVTPFFPGHTVSVGGVILTWHQLVVMILAVTVAAGLAWFLSASRTGIAMRAVVDDPDLLAMTGARPARIAALGWSLGSSLAALAGILLAPLVTLDQTTLTFLVVNGLAAAVVGRLRSLPWTFAGGLALGLLEQYATGYLPVGNSLTVIKPIIPMVFLAVALLALPPTRVAAGLAISRAQRLPKTQSACGAAGLFVIASAVASQLMGDSSLATGSHGVALGIVLLSLVPLSGYAGQVSLCQLTFAGLGAFAMSKVGGDSGSLLGIVAAIALPAAVGAVIALPALRLNGLYLALATLAFAYAMDFAFFQNDSVMGETQSLTVSRPDIGLDLGSEATWFVFLSAVFALLGIGVIVVRKSRFGRQLVAMGDSPRAAATSGISVTRSKVLVFALSAGMAGLGGALYGGEQTIVDHNDFALLASLTLLLLAVVSGIRSVTGMYVAGILLALGPVLQSHAPSDLRDVVYLLVGGAALGVAHAPDRSPSQAARSALQRHLTDRRVSGIPSPRQVEEVAGALR